MADNHAAAQAGSLPWGTQWDLVRAAHASVEWSSVLITLGLQDGRAGGRSAVNRYFGTCRELPGNELELGPFGMTMMAGSPEAMAAETAYHRLLEQVRGFRVRDDELVLVDGAGIELLAFAPSADPA